MINLSSSVSSVKIFPVQFTHLQSLLEDVIPNKESKQICLSNKRVIGYTLPKEDFEALGEFLSSHRPVVSFSNEEFDLDTYNIQGHTYNVQWFTRARKPFATICVEEKYQV